MASQFDVIKKEVDDIVAAFKANAKPGWVGLFGLVIAASGDFVELVEATQGIVKSAKKETVIEAVRYAYAAVDPDLPWIPEPFETKLETWVLDNLVPTFIDWLVNKYHEKGIFKHA